MPSDPAARAAGVALAGCRQDHVLRERGVVAFDVVTELDPKSVQPGTFSSDIVDDVEYHAMACSEAAAIRIC